MAGSSRRVDGRCVASVSVSLGLAVANRQGCVAGSSRIDKQLRVCSAIGETQRKTKNPARLCELYYFTSSAARGGRRGNPRRLPRTDVGGSARVGVCGFRLQTNREWNSRAGGEVLVRVRRRTVTCSEEARYRKRPRTRELPRANPSPAPGTIRRRKAPTGPGERQIVIGFAMFVFGLI